MVSDGEQEDLESSDDDDAAPEDVETTETLDGTRASGDDPQLDELRQLRVHVFLE